MCEQYHKYFTHYNHKQASRTKICKKVLTFEVNIWFRSKRPAYYTKSRFIGFYYPSYQYEVVKKSVYRKYDIVLHKY